MYRIHNIKNFLKCPRYYYLNKMDEDEKTIIHLRNDYKNTDLLKRRYQVGKCFVGQKHDSNQVFFQSLHNYNWFAKVRLEYQQFRIKIPFIHKVSENTLDLYYFQGIQNLRIDDPIYYSTHLQVLEHFGFTVRAIYILTINPKYIRRDCLDYNQLLVEHHQIFDQKTKQYVSIVDYIHAKYKDLDILLFEIKNHRPSDFKLIKTRKCFYKGRCRYFDQCFEKEDFPDNSILTLVQSQFKQQMYQEGIVSLKDAEITKIEGSGQQYAQIMADRNGGLFIDYLGLQTWLEDAQTKTISFLDFEWDSFLIPPYHAMKSFSALCFEFSLHILHPNGELSHFTYIGKGDCRKEFVETLLKYLPKTGSIFAYNAKGAEILRLKELAEQVPEYQNEINSLIPRFVDLADPFSRGYIYDVRMKGSYSLKTLIEVASELSYNQLNVHDGMEAVEIYRLIDQQDFGNNQLEEYLRQYCGFDTYAMYIVYLWLLDTIKDK